MFIICLLYSCPVEPVLFNKQSTCINLLTPKISFSNSPYCLKNSFCDVSLENLVLYQLIIP